ncbi:HNH endonuclease [Rhizobium sp. T136]|uniref:HNH endonuclease signature motif containing protein n=1 Tax=Rhizobium sp. T136 TaxID=555319 RepID=UPI001E30596E|nr:HNH endonuclease signature motif containing protein [Rhizobium sp. T136]UFS83189.1 HNH endonuclease [Rhizobium sp. T136]
MKALPSQEYLHECFSYDQGTGILTWKFRPFNHFEMYSNASVRMGQCQKLYAGRPALNVIKKNGYRSGTLDGVGMYAHRVIWKMINGSDPNVIDHIDGDKANNRLINLRNVSPSINMRNLKLSGQSASGVRGVYRHSQSGGWLAQINTNAGNVISFYSKDMAEAVEWRREMELEFGYITRTANG